MKVQKRNRTKKSKDFKVIVIVSFIIALVFVYKGVELISYAKEQTVEIDNLKEKIAEEKFRKEQLAEQKKYINTDSYIEKIANDMLGLIGKDDIIFKPER